MNAQLIAHFDYLFKFRERVRQAHVIHLAPADPSLVVARYEKSVALQIGCNCGQCVMDNVKIVRDVPGNDQSIIWSRGEMGCGFVDICSAGSASINEPLHIGLRIGVEVGDGEDAMDVIDSCCM